MLDRADALCQQGILLFFFSFLKLHVLNFV